MYVSYSSWTHHHRKLWHNSVLYLIPFGFTYPTQKYRSPITSLLYLVLFPTPGSQSLLVARFGRGLFTNETKRNETKRNKTISIIAGKSFLKLCECMYVHIAIFSFATQTQLPSCLFPLLLFSSLMMILRKWERSSADASADMLRRKACSYTSKFTRKFMGQPTQGTEPDRMPQTEVALFASNRTPPPGNALSEFYCVQTPLLLSNDSICSFATHTHTQTQSPANIQTITLLK